ncbi:MAG: hypothetical protein K6T73_08785 [Candidatus Bathyarchaeota archaeon]|nr:hypothetical protein [Candidatus Bathyarchaeota archaeon]
MPRPKKYSNGEAHCFHVDGEVYARLKQVLAERFGKSVSEEVNDFLRKRLVELEGTQPPAYETVEYEALKREYAKLFDEVERLKAVLKKAGCYDELINLVRELGLDFGDLHNMWDIVPKLMQSWKDRGQTHMFINLLETAKKKRELERKLTQARMAISQKTQTNNSSPTS